jgi:hypothetical protein
VHLAARIGEPVDEPWVGVQAVLDDGVALADLQPGLITIVRAELATLPEFRLRLSRGDFPVC